MTYNELTEIAEALDKVAAEQDIHPDDWAVVLLMPQKDIEDIDYDLYHRTTDDHYDTDFHANHRQLDITYNRVLLRLIPNDVPEEEVYKERMTGYLQEQNAVVIENPAPAVDPRLARRRRRRVAHKESLVTRFLFQPVRNWIRSIRTFLEGPGK